MASIKILIYMGVYFRVVFCVYTDSRIKSRALTLTPNENYVLISKKF